jgi:hypothetical protein
MYCMYTCYYLVLYGRQAIQAVSYNKQMKNTASKRKINSFLIRAKTLSWIIVYIIVYNADEVETKRKTKTEPQIIII